MPRAVPHFLLLISLLGAIPGCRILAQEAACSRDRDCPDSLPVCDAPDAGVGVCVEATDAGTLDAGTPDAGTLDAGPPDAGPPDASSPDAGPPDAGTTLDGGPDDAG